MSLAPGHSAKALSLYRSLIRNSSRFSAYNIREYALRRSRDAFRSNRSETNPAKVEELMNWGRKELGVAKRQSVISQFYKQESLVVENHASAGALNPKIES